MSLIEKTKDFEFIPQIQPSLINFFSNPSLSGFNPQEIFSMSNSQILQNPSMKSQKFIYPAALFLDAKSAAQAKSSQNLQSEIFAETEESATTKSSEGTKSSQPKKGMSQKKSYKKAPQGKMESDDEQLLLTLASKYKHDWKKVSKKIFKLHKKKLGPNLLRIRYKELAPDLTQKRVRFTHSEDLRIIKYYGMYGYDWEKISSHFESRTAIMVKNRFYHIKKKNILEKLMEEVERTKEPEVVPLPKEEADLNLPELDEHQSFSEPRDEDAFQFFVEKGQQIYSKTLNLTNIDNYFDFEPKDQLYEKITPMETAFTDRLFEDDGLRTPTNWNSNNYFLF